MRGMLDFQSAKRHFFLSLRGVGDRARRMAGKAMVGQDG
jgi:hypothetical protein